MHIPLRGLAQDLLCKIVSACFKDLRSRIRAILTGSLPSGNLWMFWTPNHDRRGVSTQIICNGMSKHTSFLIVTADRWFASLCWTFSKHQAGPGPPTCVCWNDLVGCSRLDCHLSGLPGVEKRMPFHAGPRRRWVDFEVYELHKLCLHAFLQGSFGCSCITSAHCSLTSSTPWTFPHLSNNFCTRSQSACA